MQRRRHGAGAHQPADQQVQELGGDRGDAPSPCLRRRRGGAGSSSSRRSGLASRRRQCWQRRRPGGAQLRGFCSRRAVSPHPCFVVAHLLCRSASHAALLSPVSALPTDITQAMSPPIQNCAFHAQTGCVERHGGAMQPTSPPRARALSSSWLNTRIASQPAASGEAAGSAAAAADRTAQFFVAAA